ncbi:MAG: hypothetical protein ACRD2T_09415 [Thermoanaerobaculia bacterium]
MKTTIAPIVALGLFAAGSLQAAETQPLDERLEALRPFLGKTWRGEFKGSTPEKPRVDVSRWERALNGKAVRILHSVNDGAYGGESLVVWDQAREKLAFYYFTTAGFYTTGTMTFAGGKLTSHETVAGSAGGVTEVRATHEIRPDGSLVSKSEHLKDGKWIPGREVVYREDPKAEVKFK